MTKTEKAIRDFCGHHANWWPSASQVQEMVLILFESGHLVSRQMNEEQIWKCNQTEDNSVHICLEHQNVVDFARSIEREIGFAKAELWIKRINDAVLAEREACAAMFDDHNVWDEEVGERIRARGTT